MAAEIVPHLLRLVPGEYVTGGIFGATLLVFIGVAWRRRERVLRWAMRFRWVERMSVAAWKSDFDHESADVRDAAARRLSAGGDITVNALLVVEVKPDRVGPLASALKVLAQSSRGFPAIRRAASDRVTRTTEARTRACRALGQAGLERAVDTLEAILTDANDSAEIRVRSAEALREIPGVRAGRAFGRAFDAGVHFDVQVGASNAMDRAFVDAPVDVLCQVVADVDRPYGAVDRIIRWLAEREGAQVTNALVRVLANPDSRLRTAAMEALRDRKERAAIQHIQARLEIEGDVDVRDAGCKALRVLNGPEGRQAFEYLSGHHTDMHVRPLFEYWASC